MAQIEDITSYILDKYKAEAKAIEDAAKARYESVINEAEQKAEEEFDSIMNAAAREADRRLAMAGSSAGQIMSAEILALKNQAADSVIAKAKEKLLKMDEKDYEAFLISLLKRYSENKDGEIILSLSDDTKGLKALKKEAGTHGLVISKKSADISGGFILKYGNIEQNCSIDAIFKEKKEVLTDYINSNLFK